MLRLKQCLLIASLLWIFGQSSGSSLRTRSLQDGGSETQRSVVYLLPFDIRIAIDGNSNAEDVNVYALKQIVNTWMDDSFKAKSENEGLLDDGTTFDYVLLEIANRRELQEANSPSTTFYKAVFRGFSVWNLGVGATPLDPELVELIQRATFLEDKTLLELVRQADAYTGLGDVVLDIRAEVSDTSASNGSEIDPPSTDKSLEIIITIAIVVACLAFCLLMFAVIWAWRTDRAKRESYKVGRNRPGVVPDRTGSESDDIPSPPKQPKVSSSGDAKEKKVSSVRREAPPTVQPLPLPDEIPTQSNYPESLISDSVVSDDVDTTFTAYYQNQMPHQQHGQPKHLQQQPVKDLNDAASMSSMDSYGYSLDGYASSLGPAQKFPAGALSMPNTALGADDSDADLAPSENGDSVPYK
jgi:hypothetical protein